MSSAAYTVKSSKSKSTSSDKSKSSKSPPPMSPIVALPSMSSHLFSLPQARNLDSLPVHPSQSAQRHAESEAKLKKALERNAARQTSQSQQSQPAQSSHYPRPLLPPPIYSEPNSPSSHSPPLMMRPRPKPTYG